METYIDLHIHTIYSDGCYRPEKVVSMAAEKGLRAIAIADHDSVEGIDEALLAGQAYGVEVVPAVEFSIAYGKYRDIHLLGYFIDYRDEQLQEKLEDFRRRRDDRARAIIEKINARLLHENRGNITYDEVSALAEGAISRLHLAHVLLDKGLVKTVHDAFKRYLVPCDVAKQYFPMEDALAEIRRLKGVAVLAHPTSITDNRITLRSLVGEWREMGLDGIEVFNNLCYDDDMLFLESLAGNLGLAMTGGSDFHGFEDDVEIGVGSGGLAVAYRLLQSIKAIAVARGARP